LDECFDILGLINSYDKPEGNHFICSKCRNTFEWDFIIKKEF